MDLTDPDPFSHIHLGNEGCILHSKRENIFLEKSFVWLALVSHGLIPIFLLGYLLGPFNLLNLQLFILILVYLRAPIFVLCSIFLYFWLPKIISSFSLNSHIYTDDSYIYSSFSDSSLDLVVNKIKSCLHTIISWSSSMCHKLNPYSFNLFILINLLNHFLYFLF